MSGYLVDTNVLSEYAKPEPNSQVMLWFDVADARNLYASEMTLGELLIGVEALPQGKRRAGLEAWLESGLPAWFAPNLLPITPAIVKCWSKLAIEAKRRGTPLPISDGLIAATAFEHDLILVTRNVKDFSGLGIHIFNPWDEQAGKVTQ